MKPRINHLPLTAPILSVGLILVGHVAAQTLTTLHDFDAFSGISPTTMFLSGRTLYGTTFEGGASGGGTVFSMNVDGSGFRTLLSFSTTNGFGNAPMGSVILCGDTVYGTTSEGGQNGFGTIFALNTNGEPRTFLVLHDFEYHETPIADGAFPYAGLVYSGNTLYGTASRGGTNFGTVFAINMDGTGYENIHSFTDAPDDGWEPWSGLVLSGNKLYGTTAYDGTWDSGRVFVLNTNGTGVTILHQFTPMVSSVNSDGAVQFARLALSGNTLYGTANLGGTNGQGTIFALNTDGTGFTVLHSFAAITYGTNNDGAQPYSSLVVSGNVLYGTAPEGGTAGNGTVFALNTDGTGFTTLHSFTGGLSGTNSDGANPYGGLVLCGNALFGTTVNGGITGYGTVFSLSLPPPQLTYIVSRQMSF